MKYYLLFLLLMLMSSTTLAQIDGKPDTAADTHSTEKGQQPINNIENKNTLGITLGYSYNPVSVFIIEDPDATEADNKTRARFSGTSHSPYLTLTTGNLATADLHLQLLLEAGYSEFELDTQELEGQKLHYGTSVRGTHSYIMPQLIYNSSEIGIRPNREKGFRIGGGVGIGWIRASGTAVYTDLNTRQSANPLRQHTIDLNQVGLSVKLLAEYHLHGLVVGLTGKGIVTKDKDNEGNHSNYSFVQIGLNLAYSLYF